jgi:hypothetical protein
LSLKHRIANLEELEDHLASVGVGVPSDFDLDDEVERWNGALGAIAELLADAEAANAVSAFLQAQLSELCGLLDLGAEWNEYKRRRIPELRRWPTALVTFFRLLPEGLRAPVATSEALTGNHTFGNPWLNRWLFSVVCFRSRLPPEMAQDTMARLVAVYTEQAEKVDSCGACVCAGCGLLRPRHKSPPLSEWKVLPGKVPGVGSPPWSDLPEFFDRCPHCGADGWTWESRVDEEHHSWRDLAAAELGPAD